MNGAIALKKAKSYTDESLLGGGAVVGKNVTLFPPSIGEIEEIVTFLPTTAPPPRSDSSV